jgi:FMN-dependent NADH-azoreductase
MSNILYVSSSPRGSASYSVRSPLASLTSYGKPILK